MTVLVAGLGLSLSDDATLEYVLSDIPFYCVGLTALAVFAFFIVLRRINLASIYLYTSSLLAFGAAILDLVQILIRGTVNTDKGLDLGSVTGIVNTREVGLALAFGFRFLYLWALVAERPRFEPRPRSEVDPLFSNFHSASWERWGTLGFILKYALLGSIISIPILQIIWRIATEFSAVYIAESTLQIAVSVLLIAKLMLNLYLSTVTPWWRPFTAYIVPFVALLISTGIGAGELLYFKFSETTLGRFLQAVEMYMLILYLLIITFYEAPRYRAAVAPVIRKRSSFFAGLPQKMEEAAFRVSSPIAEIPARDQAADRPTSRESPISRISSWISIRRPQRPVSGQEKLWNNAGQAELGISTEVRAAASEDSVPEPSSPRVEALAVPNLVVPPTPTTVEAATPSTAGRFTGVSFASYYGMATAARLTMPNTITPSDESRGTDSPVYGLDGIVNATAPESPAIASQPIPSPSPSPQPPSPTRLSTNSFDELLRQQTELDKSIAALRLFSPEIPATTLPPPPPSQPDSRPVTDRTLSVSSEKSTSNRSEFSLSIFPDPPLVDRATVAPTVTTRARDPPFPGGRLRMGRRMGRQSRLPHSIVSDIESPPAITPDQSRIESAGTQYDVTSFIGDLTIPRAASSGTPMDAVGEGVETDSDMESPVISTAVPALRPLLLSSTAPAITSLPPGAPGGSVGASPPSTYEYPTLKPLLLGSTPTVPSPLSAGARRTLGTRRPSRAGQTRPVISVPRQMESEQVEEAAFEQPRTPPPLNP
ncbi:hypothetical protein FB45DRAFT_559554 [Roridomyces roridus]|uniref:Uncharacterized protein n=1 Tax=Roridomyces roridus TaxID=1738132 RepID=A0AAD7BUV7_9AGAR|nr:hypothetical protein FB45DRAFT_559554 [Roridomyces roridus]